MIYSVTRVEPGADYTLFEAPVDLLRHPGETPEQVACGSMHLPIYSVTRVKRQIKDPG